MNDKSAAQPTKVFLQKRSLSGDMKQVPGLVAASAPKMMKTASVTCSLCPESFPGAKELGLHILAAHCDSTNVQCAKPVLNEAENNTEENVVVDANPGLFMEVDVVEKRQEAVVVKSTPTTISPRLTNLTPS